MALEIIEITLDQLNELFARGESHFLDFKAKDIAPSKLTRTLSAFANAEGGELFIGICETNQGFSWAGFSTIEDANSHVAVIESLFPLGATCRYSFLRLAAAKGLVLRCEIDKSLDIKTASDGTPYLRRGAQNLPLSTPEKIERLKYAKGIASFEDQICNAPSDAIVNSEATEDFSAAIIPTASAPSWLRKQQLIISDRPTVAGVLLFSDEPQIYLPKASIKIYRYKSNDAVGTRDTLAFDPVAVEGNAYNQIYNAVEAIKKITESIPVHGAKGLQKIDYPTEAIHEVITNAVIHRDYSINDDIHVRIFDSRIEVVSPGGLPGHVTVKNFLDERFARNPKLVRLLNKFPNPPNKDVGEGLNTAFESMRKLKLRDPVVAQGDNSVHVTLKHEKLGSPEQIIVEYLRSNQEINNSIARQICHIGSENTVKRIFTKMLQSNIIKRIPNRPLNKTGYIKGKNFPK